MDEAAGAKDKAEIANRRKRILEAVISAVPVLILWFVILNENACAILFGTSSRRMALALGTLGVTVSWTYWTLKRFSEAGILQVRWLPRISTETLIFLTLVLLGDMLLWMETSDFRYLLGGILFFVFYLLIAKAHLWQKQGT